MKKAITAILCVMLLSCFIGVLVGCDTTNPTQPISANEDQIRTIYGMYVAYADDRNESPLSYEEWLKSIKGETGAQGIQGIQGNGITKIEKTSTIGNVDTYVIYFSNNQSFEFTITNGKDGASPLYVFLKEQRPGRIAWNFAKFLIDRNGNVVDRFAPSDKPETLHSAIEAELNK